MLLALAWKNIWRHKKRSLIVIAAITFGLWGGLLSGGVMMGMSESMIRSAIDRDLAHLQIHPPAYQRAKELKNTLPDGPQMVTTIRHMPGVKAVSGRTLVYGMASSPASAFGVKIVGLDPDHEREVTTLPTFLIEGSYFAADHANQIVIGQKLAQRLNVKLRAKIVVNFEGLHGEIVSSAVRVAGIYKTASSQFDELHVFVPQSDLWRVLDSEPIVHELAIRAESSALVNPLEIRLKSTFRDLDVQTWNDLAPELGFIDQMMELYTYLFVAIILLALLFGITNTMLMSVVERFHEFGVLIAVGMKPRKVFALLILETLFLSLVGGLAGILVGGLSIRLLAYTGIDLSAFSASMESFGANSMLYPFLPGIMYLVLTVMVMVAAILAAIMPAWKAVHLQPAEAIRVV